MEWRRIARLWGNPNEFILQCVFCLMKILIVCNEYGEEMPSSFFCFVCGCGAPDVFFGSWFSECGEWRCAVGRVLWKHVVLCGRVERMWAGRGVLRRSWERRL